MTEHQLGYQLSLEKVLPQFFNIKNKINVSESILLAQLNRWSKDMNKITKNNIHNIIPTDLFSLFEKNNQRVDQSHK